MHRALLAELQRHDAYPSVTLLLNTTPGSTLTPPQQDSAHQLSKRAFERLDGDAAPDLRQRLDDELKRLIHQRSNEPAGHALALCVADGYSAAVSLGRAVEERVVIDDTFATRDLVADLNRTALYRIITISDHKVRVLIGDRQRLVEERDETWPLLRIDDESQRTWLARLTDHLRGEHRRHPLPTVIAGVERSVRSTAAAIDPFDTIGFVPGNHDRTSWVTLHTAAWPLVVDWLRTDRTRALQRLEHARSSRRYAGGIDEIWPLARDGRVELLVVEDQFTLPVRIDQHHQLRPAPDIEAPDVIDDIVDETIETVLRSGGSTVIVSDGDLTDHDRIAAVLRY